MRLGRMFVLLKTGLPVPLIGQATNFAIPCQQSERFPDGKFKTDLYVQAGHKIGRFLVNNDNITTDGIHGFFDRRQTLFFRMPDMTIDAALTLLMLNSIFDLLR